MADIAPRRAWLFVPERQPECCDSALGSDADRAFIEIDGPVA